MKNNKLGSLLSVGAAVAVIAASALTVQAATVSVTGAVGAAVNSTTAVPVTTSVAVPVSVNVSASSTGVSADMSGNTSAAAGMSTGAMLNLGQSSVSGSAAAMMSANAVTSDDTLNAYAQGELASDANITNVSANDTSVSVQYMEPVKFLGFIPAHETATATVNQDGTVSVHYPWYGFLSAKSGAAIQSDIQSRTTSVVEANGSANASFTAATKAQLLDNVISVLKNYNGSVSASAAANASANTTSSY